MDVVRVVAQLDKWVLMPYVSKAQQRFFHANEAKLAKQGVDVHEWDKATQHQRGGFSKLPQHAGGNGQDGHAEHLRKTAHYHGGQS